MILIAASVRRSRFGGRHAKQGSLLCALNGGAGVAHERYHFRDGLAFLAVEKSITSAVSIDSVVSCRSPASGDGMNWRSMARRPIGSRSSQDSISVISIATIGLAASPVWRSSVIGSRIKLGWSGLTLAVLASFFSGH